MKRFHRDRNKYFMLADCGLFPAGSYDIHHQSRGGQAAGIQQTGELLPLVLHQTFGLLFDLVTHFSL